MTDIAVGLARCCRGRAGDVAARLVGESDMSTIEEKASLSDPTPEMIDAGARALARSMLLEHLGPTSLETLAELVLREALPLNAA